MSSLPMLLPLPPLISKMDIRHLLREDYKEKNNLSSSEKAIIRDVSRKIRDDNIANKFYEIYRRRRSGQEEQNEQSKQNIKGVKENKEKRRNIKIKAVGILCAGTIVYVGAVLITR